MAKITIEIEDIGSQVRVNARPRMQDLMTKAAGQPEGLTAAETYGIAALTKIMKMSKEMEKRRDRIVVPGRPN